MMAPVAPSARAPLDVRIGVLSIALVALALPLAGLRYRLAEDTPLFHFAYLFDVPAVVAIALALPRLRRSAPAAALAGTAFLALAAVALAAHPSARGLHLLARLVEAGLLAAAVALVGARAERVVVAAALVAAAAAQTLIAIAQVQHGAPVGIGVLGEFADPLVAWGTTVAPRGTLTDGSTLAGLALLAAAVSVRHALSSSRALAWIALAALTIVPLGLSSSRTAIVGAALVCACLAPLAARSTRVRWAIGALVIGVAIPAAVQWDGWTASGGRGAASDRGALVAQAAAIIASSPLVGVGPARYDDVLASRPELHTTAQVQPVHDVPALVAAEDGIPSAAVVVALLAIVMRDAWRRGWPTLAVAAALVAWILLDQWPYTNPTGLALVGLWLGLSRWPSGGPPPR